MARYKARVDVNQPDVVKGIREFGATVQHLHTVGRGCPDILVGYEGANFLFEIKDPDKSKSAQRLTPDEVEWHEAWQGQVATIRTAEEAIQLMLSTNQST